MNKFMLAQIASLKATLTAFEQAIALSAVKDDGVTSRKESREIRKIKAATGKLKEVLSNAETHG